MKLTLLPSSRCLATLNMLSAASNHLELNTHFSALPDEKYGHPFAAKESVLLQRRVCVCGETELMPS